MMRESGDVRSHRRFWSPGREKLAGHSAIVSASLASCVSATGCRGREKKWGELRLSKRPHGKLR